MKTSIIISICIIVLCACKDNATNTNQQANGFAIYKLADSTIRTSQIVNTSLDSIVLSSMPFLTSKDLKSYHWSTHTFFTNSYIDSEFSKMKYWGGQSSGLPFVVVVNQTRIYLGTFWWPYSSSMPQVPYIWTDILSPYQINRDNIATEPDKRNDPRIYEALLSAGVLRE
jgi:hypothetical protein